jgi:hypothetical protein
MYMHMYINRRPNSDQNVSMEVELNVSQQSETDDTSMMREYTHVSLLAPLLL